MSPRPSHLLLDTLYGIAGLFVCLLLLGAWFRVAPHSLNRSAPTKSPSLHRSHLRSQLSTPAIAVAVDLGHESMD